MDEPVPSPPPGDDRTRRRSLFSGRGSGDAVDVLDDAAARVEQLMSTYQATIQHQLEDGLRRIQASATGLMHEIASEVWRTAGGDKDEARSKILQELSRDQAIRSLIAHSDERFQALAVRTARLEDTLNHVAESVRGAREQIADGIVTLDEAGSDSPGTRTLYEQLAAVTREVASALGTLADRDQAVVDAVRSSVHDHGELITQETTRISAAMESYVQHGVEAVGQLAGNVDLQVQTLVARDDEIAARIAKTVDDQMTLLAEQLQLLYERMAIDASSLTETVRLHTSRSDERIRAVGEVLHLLGERIDVTSRDAVAEVRRSLEGRVMGLAQLVRSDSEALRRELVRTAATLDERTAALLDERLGTVTTAVTESTVRMIDELGRWMQEETSRAVRGWMEEAMTRLESRAEEQTKRFDDRADETLSAVDRSMVRMTDAIEGQFERIGRTLGDRAAESTDAAIAARFDDLFARLQDATTSVGRVERSLEDGHDRIERAIETTVETRISSLARLVRSDNETLAAQIVADQDASKQALRSMKELQANLPAEVIDMVEQRFASLAESIERSNEMLAKRIDRMADKIGERYDNDIQIVVDRMGDAMHALASLGRPGGSAAPMPHTGEPRIELE